MKIKRASKIPSKPGTYFKEECGGMRLVEVYGDPLCLGLSGMPVELSDAESWSERIEFEDDNKI